jgi:hypothetical protein
VLQPGKGRPARYCSLDCRRLAEAAATIRRVLPGRAEALLYLVETIEAVDVSMAALTDEQVRRLRAAAFTVASRGRRLAPGTSGRYRRSDCR